MSYPIHVGEALTELRREVLGGIAAPNNRLLVTDTNVAAAGHADAVATELGLSANQCLVLPAGETHKTPETILGIARAGLAAELDREGCFVALGGGVIGDLSGLAAALYMRGVAVVQLPTSLLAMVDASLGGKTGVDLPEGKNLLGTFHHPRAVIADIAHLRTLPKAEISHGLAEMLKHGWIADPALLAELEALPGPERLTEAKQASRTIELIRRAVAVKVAIVQADERERGRRMLLNFGHTIGHALEAATTFALPHGAAVAIGMVAETHLAQALGHLNDTQALERLEQTLPRLGLPTRAASRWVQPTLTKLNHDKKRHRGTFRLAVPTAPGQATILDSVNAEQIEATLRVLWTDEDGTLSNR